MLWSNFLKKSIIVFVKMEKQINSCVFIVPCAKTFVINEQNLMLQPANAYVNMETNLAMRS